MSDGIQLATAAGLVWWLSRQFSSVRDLAYRRSVKQRDLNMACQRSGR